MNTAEHVVEAYYRFCKKCFTIDDVKVIDGINRQIDLLAVNLISNEFIHIESTVTHRLIWKPTLLKFEELFTQKYLGLPKDKSKKTSKKPDNTEYYTNIINTYKKYYNKELTKRVICVWHTDISLLEIKKHLKSKIDKKYHSHIDTLEVLQFRDTVLRELKDSIGTANYDDEILRMISFINQYEEQKKKERKKES